MIWSKFPSELGDDPRLQACALAYLSDMNPMEAVVQSHPDAPFTPDERIESMAASLDHAIWFHRPAKADDWLLFDMSGHGMIHNKGLATGLVFMPDGTHVATIAQEGLYRRKSS